MGGPFTAGTDGLTELYSSPTPDKRHVVRHVPAVRAVPSHRVASGYNMWAAMQVAQEAGD